MKQNWRIIHPDDYFHHEYSQTWHTEREIEIAVALRWLNENPNDVLEVGAVMPYYHDEFKHEVIDPYDERATIVDFMENQDLLMMNVLSISTIEHIGTTDYATNERQNIVDNEGAIVALKKILDESDNCLVSFPVGYNKYLDSWVEQNLDKLKCFGYEKIRQSVTRKSLWNYYESVKSLKGLKYREPFPEGNYVLFIEGWK